MAIVKEVTRQDFHNSFREMGREDNFSIEGRDLIYDWLDDYQLADYELDVIGICCEFAEYENLKEFQNDYGEEYTSIESIEEATTVLRNSNSNLFVIIQF
jgi:hypothetical protein